MRTVDLIHKKRSGMALTAEELEFLVKGYTAGDIPDYQMSAFTMAVWFRGMDPEETAALTRAMTSSGDTVDLSCFGDLSVDKHSTGGVGDKTTLIIAPIVASLGGKMAKMSGRGLGHTGGTVDKLESIPGYRTQLSPEEFLRQVEEVGVAVIGQTGNLTPADKKLYALRDVTDTVDSLPLIASSIMSKKLAAGAKNIVLDVKVGSGAFMQKEEDARALARQMVAIGSACGRRVTALLTNMDVPLGRCVGNSLEVREAVEILWGRGCEQLREVCVALSAQLVALFRDISPEEARQLVEESLRSGSARETMKRWIAAQGGNAAVVEDLSLLPAASLQQPVPAPRSGWLTAMDARRIGEVSSHLGAGRLTKTSEIDLSAGLELLKKPGDWVEAGETLAILHTNRADALEAAAEELCAALSWGQTQPVPQKLILGVVNETGETRA